MTHKHQAGGPVCVHRTKRACDDAFADWEADQQVFLADWVVAQGGAHVRTVFRGDKSVFGQLVHVLDGTKAIIDGEAPFTRRLRAALARHRAGVPHPAEQG